MNEYLSDVLKVIDRRSLLALLMTSIAVTVLEAASVSAIIPAIGLIVGAEVPQAAAVILNGLGLTSGSSQKAALLLTIAAVFVMRGALLSGILFLQARIAFRTQKQLSTNLYDRFLAARFERVVDISSTTLVRISTAELANITHGILLPISILASELALVFGALVVLVHLQPWASAGLLLGGALLAIPIVQINRHQLTQLGKTRHDMEDNRVRFAHELSSGVREVKVYALENQLHESIGRTNDSYARVLTRITFLQNLPRVYFETMGLSLLLLMCALQLLHGRSSGDILLFLSVSGIAAFRALPSVAKVLAQLQALRFYRPSLRSFLELMQTLERAQQPAVTTSAVLPSTVPLPARRLEICLRSATYRHAPHEAPVFSDVDLTLRSGQLIGLVGASGVGKSTLLDCLIGLRQLHSGSVSVRDLGTGTPTAPRVSYVPQNPLMMDATVWRNITLSPYEPESEPDRPHSLNKALEISGFGDLMAQRQLSLLSRIVEGGRNLSGGQRQRLALARAINRDADVLVLDESTSALDKESERTIIEALKSRRTERITVLVTHQPELLEHCDQVIRMQADGVHVDARSDGTGSAGDTQ